MYTISKEIKSETRVGRSIYARDFLFLIIYLLMSYVLANFVSSRLYVPYAIFSVAMAIFLTLPSSWNRKRRNWQSVILLLRRDGEVYHPVVSSDFKARKTRTETEKRIAA